MTRDDGFRSNTPPGWNEYWDAMPNAVRALYAVVQRTHFPWSTKEIRVEAWGQLCFDHAAARQTAWHMWNHDMRTGWKFVSWRVEMDTPPVAGGKLSGVAPADWSMEKYGPPEYLRNLPVG